MRLSSLDANRLVNNTECIDVKLIDLTENGKQSVIFDISNIDRICIMHIKKKEEL